MSAGAALGIMSIFNGVGRLAWGSVSDRMGRRSALLAMCIVSVAACMGFLRSASGFWMLLAGLCLAAFAYGGYLALMCLLKAALRRRPSTLQAAIRQCRNDPGGGYGEGQRCRNGELHVITSFQS